MQEIRSTKRLHNNETLNSGSEQTSGFAWKQGIRWSNGMCAVDLDYRGPPKIILHADIPPSAQVALVQEDLTARKSALMPRNGNIASRPAVIDTVELVLP